MHSFCLFPTKRSKNIAREWVEIFNQCDCGCVHVFVYSWLSVKDVYQSTYNFCELRNSEPCMECSWLPHVSVRQGQPVFTVTNIIIYPLINSIQTSIPLLLLVLQFVNTICFVNMICCVQWSQICVNSVTVPPAVVWVSVTSETWPVYSYLSHFYMSCYGNHHVFSH